MSTRRIPSDRIRISILAESPWSDIDEEVTREVLTSEVLSRHSVDLSRFKNDRGEFTRWLHIFHIAPSNTRFKITTVIPWLTDETEVDLEFHRAATALGAYSKYPLNWRSFSWLIQPMQNTPIYRVFTSSPSQVSFDDAVRSVTGSYPKTSMKDPVFWDRMRSLVLVPRADGGTRPIEFLPTTTEYINANSRLGEDCATALRGGQHRTSDRAAGLREVPSDPTRDHSDPE